MVFLGVIDALPQIPFIWNSYEYVYVKLDLKIIDHRVSNDHKIHPLS